MIITKKYAHELAAKKLAKLENGYVKHNDKMYRIVTRYDLQRIDHYKV